MWTVSAIGETAGRIWEVLNSRGKCSLTTLQREAGQPKSLVDMAVGWLAREGKVEMGQEKRAVQVWLK